MSKNRVDTELSSMHVDMQDCGSRTHSDGKNFAKDSEEGTMKKRVCVVGAGAAGMACAWSLGRFPEKFEVEVWEANDKPGGVATSDVVRSKDGKEFPLNDQVQASISVHEQGLVALCSLLTLSFVVSFFDSRHCRCIAGGGTELPQQPPVVCGAWL